MFSRILKKKVSQKSNVIELGCGTSLSTISLHKFVKNITGVDISEVALRISQSNAKKQRVKNIKFIHDDCRKLGIDSETFDLVCSQGLVEHFKKPEKIIEEHIRICKNDGFVVIGAPAKCSFFYIYYRIYKLLGVKKMWPWTEQDLYAKKDFISLLEALGYNTYYGIHIYHLSPFFLGILILEIDKSKLRRMGYKENHGKN